MAERLLIDTDGLIEYLRGREKAVDYLEGLTSELSISVISVAEPFAGLKGEQEERNLRRFRLAFSILPVTEGVARVGGLYRREYKPSHGTGLADALIAATAEELGLRLVTFNRRHFPMVSEVVSPYDR